MPRATKKNPLSTTYLQRPFNRGNLTSGFFLFCFLTQKRKSLANTPVVRRRSFTTVVKFHISDDDPPLKPYRTKINATTLKEAWKGTRHESMQSMKFENALVKRITIANKSTDSSFNAALKFFDKDDRPLYHPVPTFDSGENDEEEETELCGIPLWGDQTGAREVFHNPDPPTHAQMGYANFCIEDLERGVTHHKYDVPNREAKNGRRNVREQMQKMEITHIPKEPCAKYFEWALTQQNQLYPANFTDSPAHAVGGLPEYFCIHTADYHKVESLNVCFFTKSYR